MLTAYCAQELLLMEHGILEKPRIISGEIMRV